MLYITPPGSLILYMEAFTFDLYPFLSAPYLAATNLFSASLSLNFLVLGFFFFFNSTYKRDHTVFVFLCMTYFT